MLTPLAVLLAGPGCTPRLFEAAVMTAAVVGTVAILAHHDAHFHDMHCGHPRHWHEGRWVYHYHDHWEYYDPGTRGWYYYESY